MTRAKIGGICFLVGGLFAGWLFLTVPSAATLQSLQVGMEAPDFSLKDLEGKENSYAAFKGEKLTMLVFWASWSRKSEQALKRLQTIYEKYKDQGLTVVGINVEGDGGDTEAKVKDVAARLQLTFPIVIDYGLETFHNFGIIAVPTTVVLNPDRLIQYELSSFPLVGSEEMVDFVSATIEGRELGAEVAKKTGYQPNKQALRMFNMGMNSLKSRRMRKSAEGWFRKAIEADPQFVTPYISLGRFYGESDKPEKAKEQFEAALVKDPENVVAMCELGMILTKDGNNEEAKALLTKAIAIEEAYVPCYNYLGSIYAAEGKLDEALGFFAKAKEINAMNYEIFVYEAGAYEANQKFQEAAESYKKALALVTH